MGQVAAMIVHGTENAAVDYADGIMVRDYFLGANHCETTTTATSRPPCEQYDGCDAGFEVEMCSHQGVAHSDFDWSQVGQDIWEFFSSF